MADPYEGLDPLFAARLQAFIAASGGGISLGSGYRSVERQAQLWAEAVRKYGSEAAARKWVAPPGKSNHNRGVAYDLRFASDAARQWAHANAARFGMFFPMGHEPWHIEPIRNALEENFDPEAYTDPPIGGVPAGDPTDPGFQMTRILAVLDKDLSDSLASPTGPGTGAEGLMDAMAPAGGQVLMDEGAGMTDLTESLRQEEPFDGDPR